MSLLVVVGEGAGSLTGGKNALGCCPGRRRVSKLVKRKLGGCDAGVDLGLCLVLPYQAVAVMRFAAEAWVLKTLWISFF